MLWRKPVFCALRGAHTGPSHDPCTPQRATCCCSDAHCRLGVHTAVGDALRTPWPCPTAPSCKQSIAWAGLCAAVQQHTLARAVALTAMRLCGNPTVQMACWWARVGMDGLRNNTGWVTKRYGDDAVLGQIDGEDGVNLSHNVMYSACMYFVLVSMSSTVGATGISTLAHVCTCTAPRGFALPVLRTPWQAAAHPRWDPAFRPRACACLLLPGCGIIV